MIRQQTNNEVEFSVIIPTKDRLQTLTKVLSGLEKQTFPKKKFEVLVVDDLSHDGTSEFLSSYQKTTPLNFRCLEGQGKTAGAARNIGLFQARGDFVLFLDSDTIPQIDVLHLHSLWQTHFTGKNCILGRITMSDLLDMEEQARVNDTVLKVGLDSLAELEWQDYRTANTSLGRELCLRAGGFDEKLVAAEDTEFSSRLVEQLSIRYYYVNDIEVIHHHPITQKNYFEKGTQYGQAVAVWYQKAPQLRPVLVSRYGVFAVEMSLFKKIKYIIRAILVNRFTIPTISMCGQRLRQHFFNVSDRLFKCVFRYQLRRAFRSNLLKSWS